jgi:opacity protein-like surface antigen
MRGINRVFSGPLTVVGIMVCVGAAYAEESMFYVKDPTTAPILESGNEAWKDTSWQVGTRLMRIELQDKTRGEPFKGSFVGTITEITEDQDSAPDKVYAQYRLMKTPCWIGVSYDHVSARTMDDSNGDGIADRGGGDGFVDIQGFIPYIQAAWDNKTRMTPFVQAGYALYNAEFKADSNWSDGGRRKMNLDNTTGVELAGGLNVRLYKNWSADVFARYMEVDDVTGDFLLNGEKQSDIVFTMSYLAYGAGISCRFYNEIAHPLVARSMCDAIRRRTRTERRLFRTECR